WGDAILTGDTLFLDSIGRPDLEATPEETQERARALHSSLARLLELPGATLVLPCHASAPIEFDGRPLVATMSEVRARVALARLPETEFVAAILQRITPPRTNHKALFRVTEAGHPFRGYTRRAVAGANRG